MAQARTESDARLEHQEQPGAKDPGPAPAGTGVQAIQQLLATNGPPAPKAVVEIIDAHRGERDQILAMLQSSLGNGYVQQVVAAMDQLRASVKNREVVAGDPGDPNGGYFDASQALGGAKWRTQDGAFSGTANKEGLDTRYQANPHDAAHLKVDKGGAGSLAWEHDGRNEGELDGRYKSGNDWEVGAKRTDPLGAGSLTYGAHHKATAEGARDGITGEYASTDQRTQLGGTADVQDGHFVGELHGSEKLANGGTVAGSANLGLDQQTLSGSYSRGDNVFGANLAHGRDGLTGGLTASHQFDPTSSISGSLTRDANSTSLGVNATQQLGNHTLTESASYLQPDRGKGQAELGFNDTYKSSNVVGELDLAAGVGARDHASLKGGIDAQLAPHLYGGAFGQYSTESGKHDQAQLGASLTFTPSEKTALTLAGVIDHTGAIETRLQLDVFKQKIANVGDLADHKKDALVSLFVSYTTGGQSGMLNERLGSPQYERNGSEGQVMAGLRIKF